MILFEDFSLRYKVINWVTGIGVVGSEVFGVKIVHDKSQLCANQITEAPKVKILHMEPAYESHMEQAHREKQ